MQKFKFKKLEIDSEENRFKKMFFSQHGKRTILFAAIGAVGGFLYFYLTDGKHMAIIETADILKSMAIGAFFGIFITNSPCSRGRC